MQLEAEIRQHYELENAQHCAEWKKLHLQNVDARRALADQIERDYRALCLKLQLDPYPLIPPSSSCQQPDPAAPFIDGATASASNCADVEQEVDEWLQSHLQQNWIAQERFNIQEAFTNQTRKLQTDLDEYLEQLDADFESERQWVLTETSSTAGASTSDAPSKQKRERRVDVFKSDAQRKLLLQSTAAHSSSSWTDPLVNGSGRDGSAEVGGNHVRDVSETNRRVDELQRRLQFFIEVCEFTVHSP